MNHLVVVEIEKISIITKDVMINRILSDLFTKRVISCWNILYKVPMYRDDLGEESLEFKGCVAWVENNRAEGSKYAIVKMFII